jgi:hypothetical protein
MQEAGESKEARMWCHGQKTWKVFQPRELLWGELKCLDGNHKVFCCGVKLELGLKTYLIFSKGNKN